MERRVWAKDWGSGRQGVPGAERHGQPCHPELRGMGDKGGLGQGATGLCLSGSAEALVSQALTGGTWRVTPTSVGR